MLRTLDLTAHAKLNLTLRVTGRRADGYHLLDGMTAFCDFGDRIQVRLTDDGDRLAVFGPFAKAVSGDNIVIAVRDRFRSLAGWRQALEIEVDKRIPVAAGLGGGSSDAAAVLRALQGLYPGPAIAGDAMRALALSLGADVPVCLAGEPARMRGIGESLIPIGPLPELTIVLANPGIEVSSSEIFRGFVGPYSPPRTIISKQWTADDLVDFLGLRPRNDLLRPALAVAPEIAEVLRFFEALQGILSHGMSGSGATCFAILDASSDADVQEVVARIRQRGWWGVGTKLNSGGPAVGRRG